MEKKVFLLVICVAFLLGGCKKDVNNSKTVIPEAVENLDELGNKQESNGKGQDYYRGEIQEEGEKQQESRPEIVLSGDSILEVKIYNQESYETFIKQIEEYKDYSILYVDLLGSNTIVYLDEILSQNNFVIAEISNGGVLSAKDIEVCKETNLRDLDLKYMFQIDNCVLNLFDSLKKVLVWTDPSFEGQEFDLFHGEEWKRLMSISQEDKRDYGAVYILNEEGITYSSYEIYSDNVRENPCAVMSIREIGNKSDPVILEIPNYTTEWISKDDGSRIMLEDVNFDGHKDILYLGDNNGLYLFHRCIGFLWNEENGKYELCKTLPSHFGFIDSERKRITYYSHLSINDETYYIYEYDDGEFTEKRLEIELKKEASNPGELIWDYYENGEFLEKLILEYSNGEIAYYTFYGRDNQIISGEFPEERSYSELGMQYFPEFDFYFFG